MTSVGVAAYVIAASASVATMLARRPWVCRLARRSAPVAVLGAPAYQEMTYVLTAAWALLFAGGAAATAWTPTWVSLVVGLALLALGRLSPRLGEAYVRFRWSEADDAVVRDSGSPGPSPG